MSGASVAGASTAAAALRSDTNDCHNYNNIDSLSTCSSGARRRRRLQLHITRRRCGLQLNAKPSGYLDGANLLTVHIEWVDSLLLFSHLYNNYDSLATIQRHQIRLVFVASAREIVIVFNLWTWPAPSQTAAPLIGRRSQTSFGLLLSMQTPSRCAAMCSSARLAQRGRVWAPQTSCARTINREQDRLCSARLYFGAADVFRRRRQRQLDLTRLDTVAEGRLAGSGASDGQISRRLVSVGRCMPTVAV